MQNILKSKIFIGAVLAVAAIAAVAVIAVSVNHSSGSDLQAQLDLGKKYVSELDYENAVIAYEEALEIDPYCLEAYLGLSDAYMALGQQDKAIEVLEQAKNMLPDSVEVYASLAQMYASQNQMELAISTLEVGIQITDSDRLREMLREYQPGEEEPDQAQTDQNAAAMEGQEEPSEQEEEQEEPSEQEEQNEEEQAPAIVIGLQQDEQNQNAAPVLTVSRENEEPVRIPLTTSTLQPPLESENAGGEAVSENTDSDGNTDDGDYNDSSDGGDYDDGSGDDSEPEVTPPVTPPPAMPRTGITGNIYGIDGQGIEGVSVSVFSEQDGTSVLVSTDTIGSYLQELSAGIYRIVLSKEGYVDLSTSVAVLNDVLTSSSYVMLTEEEGRQSASLKGVAINAMNSQNIEGATVVLLTGFDNATNGNEDIIADNRHTTTGSDGSFSIEDGVNAGYYTVEVSRDGYSTYNHNETIKPGENELNISMSPEIQTQGEYRIVLTWGAIPSDLDSHLICTGNDNYHVYFGNKNSSDGKASLDRDDVDFYGPETTTVIVGAGNSYIYAIHNYSNGGARPGQHGSWNLANSGARVVVYGDEGIIFDGNVPTNEEGTTWEVFRIENGQLVVKNTIGFEHPRDLADDYSLVAAQDENNDVAVALALSENEEAAAAEAEPEVMERALVRTEEIAETAETVERMEADLEEVAVPNEIQAEEAVETVETGTEEAVEAVETGTEETVEAVETEVEEAVQPGEAGEEEAIEPGETGEEEATQPGEAGEEEATQPGEAETEEAAQPGEAGEEEVTQPGEAEAEETAGAGETESEEAPEPEDCLKPEEDNAILENTEPEEQQEPMGNSESKTSEENGGTSTGEGTEEVNG